MRPRLNPLDSDHVRDQLAQRTVVANRVRTQPEGEFVLYWMQSTHRFEENWALRQAVLHADRLGKPLLVHQGLDPTYAHASDRIHRVVDRLAERAALVVTDRFPTAGIAERTARFAARAPCRVDAVESHGIIASGHFVKEEYAARTIRPKIAKVLDLALEVDRLDLDRADLAAEIAACEIDHTVPAVPFSSGLAGARARLAQFCAHTLPDYAERRNEPSDTEGSSRLSPYLHFGQISAAEVLRTVRATGHAESAKKFEDELVTWRELALNFCLMNPDHGKLKGLPDWVHRTMEAHRDDDREAIYSREQLEGARTHDELWNAAQRELVRTGFLHNVTRMLWGKSVLLWTRRYQHALEHLIHLNDKYALDGRDPSSYGGIQWCFGKFDRPWFDKPVWGVIRPMSLARAREKFDADAYMSSFPA